MDKLQAMQLFRRVAELGSFRRAADELDLSASYVSRRIGQLEQELGGRLMTRTTRQLALTETGAAYLEHCRKLLDELAQAEDMVAHSTAHVTGRLRINAPLTLGVGELAEGLADFMADWPALRLDVDLKDEYVDLAAANYDLGFRVTTALNDSSYVARHIHDYRLHICCAPAYLARHGTLLAPPDLTRQRCFIYSHALFGSRWPLRHAGPHSDIEVPNWVRTNNTLFMRSLILRGLGIGILPTFVCREELASGALVELFPDIERPSLALFAIYPSRQLVAPRVTRCIEHLKQWYAQRYPTPAA